MYKISSEKNAMSNGFPLRFFIFRNLVTERESVQILPSGAIASKYEKTE
jgi:hypothetical protein